MDVTVSGSVILTNDPHEANAELSIVVPPVITTFCTKTSSLPKMWVNFVLVAPLKVSPTKGNVISCKLLQPLNTPVLIVVTLFGIEILTKLEHAVKAFCPIVVRPLPNVTSDKFVQPENVHGSIVVRPSPIVTLVKPLHIAKEFLPRLITEFGSVMLCKDLQL